MKVDAPESPPSVLALVAPLLVEDSPDEPEPESELEPDELELSGLAADDDDDDEAPLTETLLAAIDDWVTQLDELGVNAAADGVSVTPTV